jgi:hypothetical protein
VSGKDLRDKHSLSKNLMETMRDSSIMQKDVQDVCGLKEFIKQLDAELYMMRK